MSGIVDRMRGAAMLDVATYEEVEADESATGQAAVVVLVVAVCAAIGLSWRGGPGLIRGAFAAILSWLIWAAVTYFVGEKVFGGRATMGELLRTLGFAQAPGVLLLLAIFPWLGGLLYTAISIWLLATGVVAIRQALDITTGKAVITALIAWVIIAVVGSMLGLPLSWR
jgi:hypothetical protein